MIKKLRDCTIGELREKPWRFGGTNFSFKKDGGTRDANLDSEIEFEEKKEPRVFHAIEQMGVYPVVFKSYEDACRFKQARGEGTKIFQLVEELPGYRMVSKEMLEKAWDKVVWSNVCVNAAEALRSFQAIIRELGFTEEEK